MDFKNTALVLVDLQKGIANTAETAPHSVSTVLNNAAKMVELFRKNEGFIAFIRVDFIDGKDALKPNAMKSLPGGSPNPDFAEIVDEFGVKSTDYVVSKRGFSGFFGTDLDLQLRRRGIQNIVIGGISTHMGVDTTARDAYQNAYNQYFVSDMMSAPEASLHQFSIEQTFPFMGQVVTTEYMIKILDSKK
ncbi:isochorismatase [Staphylococcus cohnii]|uniref:Isochorismatase n=1 Tax=Staphylococcus auricularis TaxID=29379 RepID=A0ABX5IBW3_9STAP|nr:MULTISPECIES: isochorismatase family protein [Staphylococcus]PTF07446.1 isochorismatase [Staphylococcus cohnii]MBM9447968.1 isochorismatase family protein [Staphylococcus ureilyticus]MCE5039004.1 isochorismatase family protein [Staphylococcus auricularis]MCE5158579.1 isochorismatase family protein [Staphylococcus epidermidis]MEB6571074.1 isochorismatase family protein [Staphylococcus auricularis]